MKQTQAPVIAAPVPGPLLGGAYLIGIIAVSIGLGLYSSPLHILERVNLSVISWTTLSEIWAARHLVLGLCIFCAAAAKSGSFLRISITTYALIVLQDSMIAFNHNDWTLAMAMGALTLACSLAILRLVRLRTKSV